MAGRGKARATRAGPAEDQSSGGSDSMRHILTEMLTPVFVRIGTMEDAIARLSNTPSDTPTPPGLQSMPITDTPEVANPVVAAVTTVEPDVQARWMKIIEHFQKLRAPEFQGGVDPLAANKWKEDISSLLELIGVDAVQSHRLAAITLKGDARLWYNSRFSKLEMVTLGWTDFERRFDAQFISSAAKAGKEAELIDLEQGEMSVAEYESRFISLCNFTNMYHTQERQARMFERGLRPRIRQQVISQQLLTLRAVADAALAQERDIARNKEAAIKTGQTGNKSKGKRPYTTVQGEVGAPLATDQVGGSAKKLEQRTCFKCNLPGHIARYCPDPRQRGPDRNGGRGQAQGRGPYQQRVPQPYQPYQQQQMRIEAPPAGQVNAVVEVPPDYTSPTPVERVTPQLPMGEARVYRGCADVARGIFSSHYSFDIFIASTMIV